MLSNARKDKMDEHEIDSVTNTGTKKKSKKE